MANKHMKWCSTFYITREMQIKNMRHLYIPMRMAKIQTLTTANAGENVEQQGLLLMADVNSKMVQPFRRTVVVSYKTKHTFIQSGYWTPWYLSKEFDNLCLYKYLHTGVYSSFIYNLQNFEPTKIWTDKEHCSTSRQWNNFQC